MNCVQYVKKEFGYIKLQVGITTEKKFIEYRCPVCNARRGFNPGKYEGYEEKIAYQKYLQENEYIDSHGYVAHYWKG